MAKYDGPQRKQKVTDKNGNQVTRKVGSNLSVASKVNVRARDAFNPRPPRAGTHLVMPDPAAGTHLGGVPAPANPRPLFPEDKPVAKKFELSGYEPQLPQVIALAALSSGRSLDRVSTAATSLVKRDADVSREHEDKRVASIASGAERSHSRLDEKVTSEMKYDREWTAFGGDTAEAAREDHERARLAVVAAERARLAKAGGHSDEEVQAQVDALNAAVTEWWKD